MSEEFSHSSSLFLSQISQFYSLIVSIHPLYLSYLLFFSPYILKLLSFLCPLFTTTFLLLFFFFTFSNSHQNPHDQFHQLPQQHLDWFNSLFNTPSEIITVVPTIPFPLEADDQEPADITTKKETSIVVLPHVKKDTTKEAILGVNDERCKVFEDEDEMDLLWEKYEEKECTIVEKCEKKSCNSKKDLRSLVKLQKEMEEEEEEEEEEESGKICCLQALKFSTGKMRFGMGKKIGFTKISKAFKGLKLLHQLANNGKNKMHS